MNRLTRPDEEWGQLKAKIKSAEDDSANDAKILANKLRTALNNRTITISKADKSAHSYRGIKKKSPK